MNKMNKKINMDEINNKIFDEGLVQGALNIKDTCKRIDFLVNRIARSKNMYHRDVLQQYQMITELMNEKNNVLCLQNYLIDWYKAITSKKYKQIFVAYYIKKDFKLCEKIGGSHYKDRYLDHLNADFVEYAKRKSKFDEEKLFSLPSVNAAYFNVLDKNRRTFKNDMAMDLSK